MGYIYKITNNISGKCYIGQTREETPEKRWKAHRASIKSGKGCNALINGFRKYGLNNFKFEVIIICFNDTILEMEKYYIKKYNSQVPNGYNITAGGMGANYTYERTHSEETKYKIQESILNYYANGGSVNIVNTKKHQEAMAKAVGHNVYKYDLNNNIIEEYPSIAEAARKNNIPNSSMKLAVKIHGKAGGFIWKKIPKDQSTCYIVE